VSDSLDIIPQNVDVNIHPTKREVHFLDEEFIIEAIASEMTEVLASKAQSRVFEYQVCSVGFRCPESKLSTATPRLFSREALPTALPNIGMMHSHLRKSQLLVSILLPYFSINLTSIMLRVAAQMQKVYSQHKVRNSQQDRTLESMFPVVHPATQGVADDSDDEKEAEAIDLEEAEDISKQLKVRDIPESACYLSSVVELRQEITSQKHNSMFRLKLFCVVYL
jgi:DNA mismatch repair protein MLH1